MSVSQRWTILLTLIAVVAASAIHWLTADHSQFATPAAKLPDIQIISPEWRVFDEHGLLTRRLNAERLQRWRDEPPVLFEPRLTLTGPDRQRWQATARRGRIFAAERWLALEQQVRLAREPEATGPVVTTDYLRIAADGEMIETDRAVVIESASWHVSANGLRAALGEERMELLGKVRGIHD